ncbi:hypothetical protein PPL_01495 [Heterostelium album PN500]|uniref:RING-type E3 ubiquitin transferase n=1 Tax=Heterostelium pallidum (strain ATCC 26659 / Pp 5 / PN500) TaxID=670386 RepID=D3AZF4_HETP5|nr:hypothetical protein PPL_01495 [Heterostelium album PN500]EFA85537.1 hypothetical protein PPL_01495 [Heterostelium album PN500]|eukprot:XP_020437645.1 hypothetical protein PPL_01495 [Heterostelium album PN500]
MKSSSSSSKKNHGSSTFSSLLAVYIVFVLLLSSSFTTIVVDALEDMRNVQASTNSAEYSLSSVSLTSSGSLGENSDSNSHSKVKTIDYPRNITMVYKGEWNSTSVSHIHFSKQTGHTLFSLLNHDISSIPNLKFDTVEGEMVLRDGEYSSDLSKKYLLLGIYEFEYGLLTLIAFPPSQSQAISFNVVNTTTPQDVKNEMTKIMENSTLTQDCLFRIGLQFETVAKNENSEEIHDTELQYKLSGHYSSPFCRVEMDVSASSILMSIYRSKWINYMDFTGTQSGAAKVSLYTVGMQTIIDAYLCLIHLTAGVFFESMFKAFATAAFFQFITFSLFEMRYLLIILKARRPQAFAQGWHTFLIGGFILVYYMSHLFHIFLFIMYSFWVPQIVSNVKRSSRRPFLWSYVLGMSFTRLTIPLYFYGCPINFILLEPNYFFSCALFLWMCTQIFALYLQDRYGPTFFIPKRFLPPKYQYTRPISMSIRNREEGQGCVICMNDVEANDSDYMITPCEHLFHSRCLLRWMDYKMECPTCRRTIPPA